MRNFAFVVILSLLSLLLLSCKQQPNLVLIITDDQGYGDLSLHGNTILETPNLDNIGLNGVRLDNFHVSPVCAPTRAALLTGRRPMSTGTYWVTRGGEVMDSEEYTIAEVLKKNRYSTGYFGKWHNGSHHPHHPMSQGFDEFFGFTAGHWNRYFDPELEENGKMVQTSGFIADIFTDRAIKYICEQKDNPFFCFLAYNTPHAPFQVPDQYFDIYYGKVAEKDSALRIMNASVYGMVRNIDDNVGRVMKTLKELHLEKKTIVLFLTDNGPNTWRYNGDMKGRKGWVNDGGVRVPCFIQWKGHLPENRVIRSTTAHIDLLPTLVSLMDLDFTPRNEIHGIDLTGRFFGADTESERCLFTHVNHGSRVNASPGAVRTAEWRLTFTGKEKLELTRRSDIGEKQNLLDSFPELADSLKGLYDSWFSPLWNVDIPAIPVGTTDSVIIPAHEGFLTGNASYFWSANGWSNDWVHRLDTIGSTIWWPLSISGKGYYDCYIRYTSMSGKETLLLGLTNQLYQMKLSHYIPVKDINYNRIDMPGEAIGQSWARGYLGALSLDEGCDTLTLYATGKDVEILSVILIKK